MAGFLETGNWTCHIIAIDETVCVMETMATLRSVYQTKTWDLYQDQNRDGIEIKNKYSNLIELPFTLDSQMSVYIIFKALLILYIRHDILISLITCNQFCFIQAGVLYNCYWWLLFSVLPVEQSFLVLVLKVMQIFASCPYRSRASVSLCRVFSCNICVLWSKKLVTLYGSYWIWKKQSWFGSLGAMVI